MAEFGGTWDLVETRDMRELTSNALANVLQKITFHSGIIESRIFDVFARTKCQIEIKSEEISRPVAASEASYTNSFVGMWAKKSKTIQNRDPRDNAYLNFCIMFDRDNPSPYPSIRNCDRANGMVMKIRFRLGEEFNITVPISSEKVSSKVTRISTNNIVQRINLANGPLEITFTLNKDRLVLDLEHVRSSTYANLLFKRHQEIATIEPSKKPLTKKVSKAAATK